MASADASAIARLAELGAGGEIKPAIDSVLALDETAAASERFAAGKRGKIVISLAEDPGHCDPALGGSSDSSSETRPAK
jgi:hypothetical protein